MMSVWTAVRQCPVVWLHHGLPRSFRAGTEAGTSVGRNAEACGRRCTLITPSPPLLIVSVLIVSVPLPGIG